MKCMLNMAVPPVAAMTGRLDTVSESSRALTFYSSVTCHSCLAQACNHLHATEQTVLMEIDFLPKSCMWFPSRWDYKIILVTGIPTRHYGVCEGCWGVLDDEFKVFRANPKNSVNSRYVSKFELHFLHLWRQHNHLELECLHMVAQVYVWT